MTYTRTRLPRAAGTRRPLLAGSQVTGRTGKQRLKRSFSSKLLFTKQTEHHPHHLQALKFLFQGQMLPSSSVRVINTDHGLKTSNVCCWFVTRPRLMKKSVSERIPTLTGASEMLPWSPSRSSSTGDEQCSADAVAGPLM